MYNDEVSSDIQYLVTSIVDVNKQRRRVFVNYEPAFVLYNSEIRKYQIKVDSVIMSDIYNEIITILTKRAKIRAMALLKSHDYTEGRLREKLQVKNSEHHSQSLMKGLRIVLRNILNKIRDNRCK